MQQQTKITKEQQEKIQTLLYDTSSLTSTLSTSDVFIQCMHGTIMTVNPTFYHNVDDHDLREAIDKAWKENKDRINIPDLALHYDHFVEMANKVIAQIEVTRIVTDNIIDYFANSCSAYDMVYKIREVVEVNDDQEDQIINKLGIADRDWNNAECDPEGPTKAQDEAMDNIIDECLDNIKAILYLGHSFSEQEKEKLKKGEVIPITIESKFGFSPAKDETGTAEPKMEKVLMSVDPELNRLVTVKTSNFKLSTIKGVELSEQNKQDLLEGKKVTGALMSTGKKIPIAQKIESVKSQVQDQQKEIQQKQQQQKLTPKKNQGFKK